MGGRAEKRDGRMKRTEKEEERRSRWRDRRKVVRDV